MSSDALRTDPAAGCAVRSAASARILCALALTILALALFASPAHAVVDLLNPKTGNATNNTTVTFEYYVSMQNLTGCTLFVGGVSFADTNAKTNTINSIQVQSIAPGTYLWNITCMDGPVPEASVTRNLTIDVQAPTLALITPANGTHKEIALDLIPDDDTTQLIQCSASWNGNGLGGAKVARNTHYTANYAGLAGNGTLNVTCADDAGNSVTQSRFLTLVPEFGLQLSLDRQEYGLGDTAQLTIATLSGANVSISVCPDQPGFVQCANALLGSNQFPQTITLPHMNRTGQYLIEGIVTFAGQTRINSTRYSVANTMAAAIVQSQPPRLNEGVQYTASISGGIAPYRLRWRLSNGSTISGSTIINMTYRQPGTYREELTVFDQQNNTRSVNHSVTISPIYTLTVYAKDNATGALLDNVEIDIDDLQGKTIGGAAQFSVGEGTYRIFASAPGYQYALEELYLNSTRSVTVLLAKSVENVPNVTLRSPSPEGTVYSPVPIGYDVSHTLPLSCTLLLSTDGAWFAANGTVNTSGTGASEFLRDLAPGAYKARIDCVDRMSRTGSSGTVGFTVAQPQGVNGPATTAAASTTAAPSAAEINLQASLAEFESLINNLDGYGPKEKEIIAITGFDKELRATKRAIQQAIRDINDVQFRSELDAAGQEAERKRIIENVNRRLAETPRSLAVTDAKTYVKYLKDEDLDAAAAQLAGVGGMTADPKTLRKQLAPDQQKFTVSTKAAHVEYAYADDARKTVTLVSRSFTYGPGVGQEYALYELVPKEIAQSASDLTFITKADVAKEGLILRFGREETVTYLIPKRVDFTRVEQTKTVLARQYPEESSMITGFVAFEGGDMLSVKSPLVILAGLIILAYLAYYLGLAKQLRFLAYKVGRKEKVHYLRVLINDAADNLDSNNYEKADLLYKEIRLTYDTLSAPARNDLYEDVMTLVRRMDAYYFNLVMIELDQHLKANDMEAAIQSYEKLTGTFSRLDPERQEQLVQAVTMMARRMGLQTDDATQGAAGPAAGVSA